MRMQGLDLQEEQDVQRPYKRTSLLRLVSLTLG